VTADENSVAVRGAVSTRLFYRARLSGRPAGSTVGIVAGPRADGGCR